MPRADEVHALNKYCDIRKAQVRTTEKPLLPSSNAEHILMYSSVHVKGWTHHQGAVHL